MNDTQESEEKQHEEIQANNETREEMLSRHRKEITQLQNKEISLKKAAAKGSKAEQKAKKKQVDEQISKLTTQLKQKHVDELASVGYTTDGKHNNIDLLAKAVAGVSVSHQTPDHPPKPSKSVKRKEKRAQQEAAREQRIQQEQGDIVSDRMIENQRLERKLEPLGLTVHEIKPDGHCLYRAVEDQLKTRGSVSFTFQELRKMAADYMRQNSPDFLPFFLSEADIGGTTTDDSKRFESYCNEVESTAAWGGQLELEALTHCLRKHIMVFSGSFPDVEMGKEYRSGDSLDSSIMLSYHKHAFGLGEHYNSVVPV